MARFASDVAFTPAVKRLQSEKGSRTAYARMERGSGWETTVTPELEAFLSGLDMFYLATANAQGQPYIQYRGGPAGFLKVVDEKTLGFADFGGNRQYISTGNLTENPKAFIFLMDYVNARRIKLWGRARIVENDAALPWSLPPWRSSGGRSRISGRGSPGTRGRRRDLLDMLRPSSRASTRMEKKPRIFTMTFGSVYPLYVQKAEKKGRTREEVDQIVSWLTGYSGEQLRRAIDAKVDFESFFTQAPRMNPNASLVKGVVCGVRVEDVADPLMRQIRCLDKLIDELAKGRKMASILRQIRSDT